LDEKPFVEKPGRAGSSRRAERESASETRKTFVWKNGLRRRLPFRAEKGITRRNQERAVKGELRKPEPKSKTSVKESLPLERGTRRRRRRKKKSS